MEDQKMLQQMTRFLTWITKDLQNMGWKSIIALEARVSSYGMPRAKSLVQQVSVGNFNPGFIKKKPGKNFITHKNS